VHSQRSHRSLRIPRKGRRVASQPFADQRFVEEAEPVTTDRLDAFLHCRQTIPRQKDRDPMDPVNTLGSGSGKSPVRRGSGRRRLTVTALVQVDWRHGSDRVRQELEPLRGLRRSDKVRVKRHSCWRTGQRTVESVDQLERTYKGSAIPPTTDSGLMSRQTLKNAGHSVLTQIQPAS
jgi:hypothetical protein